jgi:hypothetical protein
VLSGVSVTSVLGSGGYFQSLTVVAFGGAVAVGASASASGTLGAPSVALVTTAPGSWVFAVGFDYDSAIARTLGAGQVMVHEVPQPGAGTTWVQSAVGVTPAAGTQVVLEATAPLNKRYDLTAIEVLPTG